MKPTPDPDQPLIAGYHIHIYYQDAAGEQKARDLAQGLVRNFGEDVEVAGFVRAGAGPHRDANIQLFLTTRGFEQARAWMQAQGTGLSILIHPETDDAVRDHTSAAHWVGEPIEINDHFLKKARLPGYGDQRPKGRFRP